MYDVSDDGDDGDDENGELTCCTDGVVIETILRCDEGPFTDHCDWTPHNAIRLRYDYDTTIPRHIRLRRKWSKLRYALDSTAMRVMRLRHDYDEKLTCSFFARVESRRMEAGARDTL